MIFFSLIIRLVGVFMLGIISIPFSLFANKSKEDSLKNVFNKTSQTDEKISVIEALVPYYWSVNQDSALHYTLELEKIANFSKLPRAQFLLELFTAVNIENIGNVEKAKNLFEKLRSSIPQNDKKLSAMYYYNYGNHLFLSGSLDSAINCYKQAINLYQAIDDENTVARGLKLMWVIF